MDKSYGQIAWEAGMLHRGELDEYPWDKMTLEGQKDWEVIAAAVIVAYQCEEQAMKRPCDDEFLEKFFAEDD